MNLSYILGPIMIGPSSSHTAGAVRIGNVAKRILGEHISYVKIVLSGSFSRTGKGHGTDRALIAGLLSFGADDERIPEAFKEAKERGMAFEFEYRDIPRSHPNTAELHLRGVSGREVVVRGESLGGGRINISRIDDIDVSMSGEYNTLFIRNSDQRGEVVKVTTALAKRGINIANMQVFRQRGLKCAEMIIECDEFIDKSIISELEQIAGIIKVSVYNRD